MLTKSAAITVALISAGLGLSEESNQVDVNDNQCEISETDISITKDHQDPLDGSADVPEVIWSPISV